MTVPNPFETPIETNELEEPVSTPRVGRVVLSLLTSILASVPFYGYYVHATQNNQMVAVWIAFAWVLGLVIAMILIATSTGYLSRLQGARLMEALLLVYTLVASLIGFFGVGNAVMELLAG